MAFIIQTLGKPCTDQDPKILSEGIVTSLDVPAALELAKRQAVKVKGADGYRVLDAVTMRPLDLRKIAPTGELYHLDEVRRFARSQK